MDRDRDDLHEVLRPIESLLGKSEKASTRLTPGSWQHSMLQRNVSALRLAASLLRGDAGTLDEAGANDLEDALAALASMITRTEGAQAKFSAGTSQHSLQRNRLRALRAAEAAVRAAKCPPTSGG